MRRNTGANKETRSKDPLTEDKGRIGSHCKVWQVKPLYDVRVQRVSCSSPGVICQNMQEEINSIMADVMTCIKLYQSKRKPMANFLKCFNVHQVYTSIALGPLCFSLCITEFLSFSTSCYVIGVQFLDLCVQLKFIKLYAVLKVCK